MVIVIYRGVGMVACEEVILTTLYALRQFLTQ